jgi:AcrR family transcriptional regulator
MARPTGSKDRDHDEKRAALLVRIGKHLSASLPDKSSLRDIAAAAGVTIPTLVHYFGSREGLLAALMEYQAGLGAPYLSIVAATDDPFHSSIRKLAHFILSGLVEARVVDLHAVGLVEASGSARLGPAYLEHLLEPTLQAVEARLASHVARGEMRDADLRVAALCLVSPVLLAALHQCSLGGDQVRHLDLATLAHEVTDSFLLAYTK